MDFIMIFVFGCGLGCLIGMFLEDKCWKAKAEKVLIEAFENHGVDHDTLLKVLECIRKEKVSEKEKALLKEVELGNLSAENFTKISFESASSTL